MDSVSESDVTSQLVSLWIESSLFVLTMGLGSIVAADCWACSWAETWLWAAWLKAWPVICWSTRLCVSCVICSGQISNILEMASLWMGHDKSYSVVWSVALPVSSCPSSRVCSSCHIQYYGSFSFLPLPWKAVGFTVRNLDTLSYRRMIREHRLTWFHTGLGLYCICLSKKYWPLTILPLLNFDKNWQDIQECQPGLTFVLELFLKLSI